MCLPVVPDTALCDASINSNPGNGFSKQPKWEAVASQPMARPNADLLAVAADRPLERVTSDHIVEMAIEHRMAGLLASRVESGQIDLDPESWNRLQEADMVGWARNRMLADVAVKLVSTAASLGLRVSIMKGLATEARWYDRPGERPSYDIDLVVHPDDLNLVPLLVEVLHPSHSLLPDLAGLIRSGHLQSLDLKLNDLPIDLHWDPLKLELVRARRPDMVWDRVEQVEVKTGGLVPAFDPEYALIGHLLHLNRDRFRYLLGFADVARILQRTELDWGFIERVLAVEGLKVPVAMSLATVIEGLHLKVRPPLSSGTGPKAQIWKRAWPPDQQLLGIPHSARQTHRQFLIPVTGSGRTVETLLGYLRRLIPPPTLINYYYPHVRGPYFWKLLFARFRRRARRRRLGVTHTAAPSHLEDSSNHHHS